MQFCAEAADMQNSASMMIGVEIPGSWRALNVRRLAALSRVPRSRRGVVEAWLLLYWAAANCNNRQTVSSYEADRYKQQCFPLLTMR